ncbi:MAG: PKD-like domain-containing protein [Bacteroidia bacterium]|nr:PKD-like domain-containing protein [Bacteroidia bacterium]
MSINNYPIKFVLKATKSILLYMFFGFIFLSPNVGNSQTVSTTVYWSSGWCTLCGTQYSCIPPYSGSGNWNNGIRNFSDPIPAGNVITQTCVTIYQANCGYSSMCATINNQNIGCGYPPGDCWCGNCWPMTLCVNGALPGYSYGGTNTLRLNPNGLTCVAYATITFTYAPVCTSSGAPSSITATPNPTCGGSTTLTRNGGSLGTGAAWYWYAGSCGGTYLGSGNSINVTPGSTTTYFVRAQGTCNTTGCASVTVTVNSQSSAPSSASASPNPLCGGSSTLTVNGGGLGTGANWYWYSGSCGGSLVGTGSSISVSPGSTTTYFVRAQGTCNTTACVSVTLTVNSPSTAPSSASASPNPTCGGATTLTLSGGSLGTGASWKWYSGSCGGSLVGTGTSISVSPGSNTTYFVRAEGTCNVTACASIAVTVNTPSVAPVGVTASVNPTCGGATTLTRVGGSLGTGATWNWFSGSCGGTAVGSGNSITVSPSSSTTYFVRAQGACNNTACASIAVTVNTNPVATATPTSQNLCAGNVSSIGLTSSVPGTTFNWTVVQSGVSGGAASSGSTIAQTLITTGPVAGTAVYTITPSAAGCTGNPISVTINVKPNPIVTATPSSQVLCSGNPTSIALTSNVAGTTFAWTVTQSGATGASASSGASIAQTLSATGSTVGTVTYTITPTASGCSGTPISVTISVKPIPVVIATPTSQTFCSGGVANIALSSSVVGTTYAWTVVQTGVSGASPGSGSTILQTLNATGVVAGTAVYTITPTANGCAGTPLNVTITVNPMPLVTATPAAQTICSGISTGISLSSNVAGTTFAWTVFQNNVTGATAGNGSSIAQVLTATGTTPGSVVYTITPTVGSCVGSPITVTITVNPRPVATATPATQTFCSGGTTFIALSSNMGATTYAWTVVQTGVSGASPGSGATIVQTLINTGVVAGTAVYSVTPTVNGCAGTPITVTITVNPVPIVIATPASQILCSGDVTGINLTSNVGGTTFSWTVTQTNVSGASAGSGPLIAQTLTATGANSGTVVYTVTQTAGACVGSPITINVSVNKKPVATASPVSKTICSGITSTITLSSSIPGTTYSWTISQSGASGAVAGSGSVIAQVLTATGTTAGTVTYTITPNNNGCIGNAITSTVTVNPRPVVTATPTSQTFCSGGISGIALTSNVAGTTFAWTVVQTDVSGASPGTGANIIQTLTSTGNVTGTAVYTITPTANGCAGTPITVTVTVTPIPVATATPPAQTICSGASNSIGLTSNVAGTTFAWTVAQTNVSGATAGSGATISQALTATATTAGTAVYSVIPTASGCPGTPILVTVTVNPQPLAIACPSDVTICSGDATSIALTSDVTGTTFAWTMVQSLATGASAGSGSTIAQTLTATSTSPGTVTYTVTPSATGCSGTPIVVNVTVNPKPVVTATPAAQTICSGNLTFIALSSNVVGTTYSWTVTQTNLTGATASSGAAVINQSLTLTGSVAGSAVYTITPTADGCSGIPITVTITVNVNDNAAFTYPSSTYCKPGVNPTPTITGLPGGSFSSVPAGLSINAITGTVNLGGSAVGTYTVSYTTSGPCPVTSSVNFTVSLLFAANFSYAGSPYCQYATNPSPTLGVGATAGTFTAVPAGLVFVNVNTGQVNLTLSTPGTYTVTNTIPASGACLATSANSAITINNSPTATATPSVQTICSGGSTSIALTSSMGATTYSWTVVQAGASGASAGAGATIAQTLTADGSKAGTAIYTIIPNSGGCPGLPIKVIITVNPIPVAASCPASQTICSGETTSVALTADAAGTAFSWTVSQTGVTGASAASGTTIAQVLTATGTVAGSVTYTITPIVGGCSGTPILVFITVKPSPTTTATPTSQTICSGTSNSIALTSNLPATTFVWTVTQTGTSGASVGGGTTIAQLLTATGVIPGTATYSIVGTSGACPGLPTVVPVTVNPKPIITATPASQTICSGLATSIALTSDVAGTTFSWTVSQSGVSGASANSGSSIAQTLTTTGVVSGTVTYTITPSANGCPGNPINVIITVNPTPVVTATPMTQTFCSGGVTGIAITSNVVGTTFSWTVVQTGVFGATAGAGTSITQLLTATGSLIGTAVYTITPAVGGCTGAPIVVTITVNPIPVTTAIPSSQSICTGTASSISLTSNVAGATFAWTVLQNDVTGATNGAGNSIAQTLSTSGFVPGNAVYTISTTANGCVGNLATVTVVVNPRPVSTATPSTQTICSGGITSIQLNSNIGVTFYSWTVVQTGVSGAAASSGASIAQTITATGPTTGTAVYTVTPSSTGCPGSPITVTITVKPKPVVTATPSSQTICTGDSTSIALTSDVAGTTFGWTVNQSLATGGLASNGSLISQVLNTTSTSPGNVTYSVTPTSDGCVGLSIPVPILINPRPIVTATPASQTICSFAATSIVLTSDLSGTAYSWTVNQTGATGASIGSGSSIVQTLSATGSVQGTVVYTITPTVTGTGCAGTPLTVTIAVNPIPVATATPTSQTICSGVSTAIALTSDVAGATFSWTVNQTNVSGATTGSASSIAQVLTSTGTVVGTAIFTIIPNAAGCAGAPISVTETVNPIPVATATPSTQTICSGISTSIALTSNVTITTYAWTVVQTGVTGATPGSGSSIAQTLSNAGTVAGTAVYTITPTSRGCSGSPITVTVTVNPRPIATATPPAQTFCTGGTTAIALTSSVAGSTFSWTRVQTGVTGATADSGLTIAQLLTTTGALTGTVVYTIRPSASGCTGNTINATITVNPMDKAGYTYTSSTYCLTGTDPTPNITGLPGGTFTSIPAGLVINSSTGTITLATSTVGTYEVTYTTNGNCPNTNMVEVSIFAGPIASFSYPESPFCQYGTNTFPTFAPGASAGTFSAFPSGLLFVNVNTGEINLQTSTPGSYTITNTIVASGGCAAVTATSPVVIGPAPIATATPQTKTICSGETTSSVLTSSMPSTSYTWTVVQTGVIGASNGITDTIAQTLITTGSVPGTAVYSVIPTSGVCVGKPTVVTITVNPIPIATAIPSTQTICSGFLSSVSLTSTVAGTTYAWTVVQNGLTGATAGSGSTIAQALTVTGPIPGTAVYTITPTASGCTGTPISVTLTVNPIPLAIAGPSVQTICSGEMTSIALTSDVPGATFTWTVSQSGASGAFDGNGLAINQILTSTFNTSPGTVTYSITSSAAGCTGIPVEAIVTVNPLPVMTATTLSNTICSGAATSIALSSNITGTTFARTVIQTGVSGGSAGIGQNIVQNLSTTGFVEGTAVYTITPTVTATGCIGLPVSVTITVTPAPVVTASPSSQTVCSGDSTSISLSSNVVGTSFMWTVTQNNVSGAISDSGSAINQTLIATGATNGTAVYIITPGAEGGCPGFPISVPVTVRPRPVATATPTAQTICSGGSISAFLSSNVAGTSYTWSVNQVGAAGATPGGGSSIAQTLIATGSTVGTVIYTITPTKLGCAGDTITVTITINPTPDVTASPSPDTICTGTTTSLALSGSVVGTNFSWTSVQTDLTGATPGSGITIAQTLINTSFVYAMGRAIYTITPIASGCQGTAVKDTVYVRPKDKTSFAYSSGTFCQSGTSEAPVITGLPGGYFYATPVGLVIDSVTGMVDFVSSALGTYTVSYTTNGPCPNTGYMNMTVALTFSAVINYIGSPFCQYENNPFPVFGDGASAGSFSAAPAGLVFVSTNTGEIDLPLSAPGSYTITNTIPPSGTCLGAIETDTVTITPAPVATATPSAQTICSGSSTSIALSSTIPGTTYTWNVIQLGVSGTSDGVFDSISQVLTTAGIISGSAVYTVTPTSADGCVGLPITVTITVDPCPIATAIPSTQVICSGDPTLIGLSSNIAGTTFTWTVVQTNVTGASDSTASVIAQTLFATDSLAGDATYTITPWLNGCAGIPMPVSIVVQPVPIAIATPSAQTICSGVTTSIALSSFVPGTTFTWTASQLGVSGGSDGAGNTITQTLSATTNLPGTVTYIITPIAAGGCPALPTTLIVIVNPRPVLTATPATQVICSGNATEVALNSTINTSIFFWTVIETGVTGGFPDTAATISQTLTNAGNEQATAVYTVTPLDTASGCIGSPTIVTLIVNPTPVVTATPLAQTICSGISTGISLSSNVNGTTFSWTVAQTGVTGAVAGSGATIAQNIFNAGPSIGTAVYTILPMNDFNGCNGNTSTVTITVNPMDDPEFSYPLPSYCHSGPDPSAIVTGLPGGSFTSSTGLVISDALTGKIDLSASPLGTHTVKYTTNGACPDTSLVELTITAPPGAGFSYGDSTFCQFGTNPLPVFDSLAIGGVFSATPSGLIFTDSITGEINLMTSLPGAYTIMNTTDTSGGCAVDSAKTNIFIRSLIATATPSSQTICSGDTTSIVLTGSLPGTTFAWEIAGIAVVGAFADEDSIIAQVLTAIDSIAGTLIYTITPTAGACVGLPIFDTVTVNPIPTITATALSQTLCSGDSTSIVLASNVAGTTFSWTVVQSGVSGASAGTDSIITQTLTTTGTFPGTAIYAISYYANGCTGDPIMDTITVNPKDDATFNYTSSTYCTSGVNPTPVITGLPGGLFTSNPAGLSIYDQTGGIDLANSLLGTYTVVYTTNGICVNTYAVTITITDTTPSANFNYSDTAFCRNAINPLPIYAPGSFAGVFTASPVGLAFANVNTGEINLSLSTPGTYTITNTIPVSGSCLAAYGTTTISIITDDASFTYPSSTFCQSGSNPTPTITGLPGGVFSAIPAGLVLDSLTGTIDLATSTLGAYTLSYATNGPCPNIGYMILTVTDTTPATSFSYANSPFCLNGSNPSPVFDTGSSAGVFSATPAGIVFVSVNTGEINLTLSTPGTYTIVNTIPASGTCLASSSIATITINVDDASFNYSSATYCQLGANPTPLITGLPGGYFYSVPVGLTIDSLTGTINLPTSALDVYTVSYTTAGSCSATSAITMTITNTSPTANFSYPGSPYCQNDNDPLPTFGPGSSGGVFSATPSGLVFVHVNTGQIDLGASLPGTYVITNHIPVSGACLAATATTAFTIDSPDNASFAYSSATYCTSGPDQTPVISGVPGGVFSSSPAGLAIDSLTGTISLITSSLGTYVVSYTTNSICQNTSYIIMTVTDTTPSADFSYPGTPFCQYGNNPYPVYVAGASAGIFSATPAGLVFVHVNTGEIDLPASVPGTYTVTNTIPESGSCLAAVATSEVTITPAPVAIATTALQSICATVATPVSIALSSNIPGSTYLWSVSQSGLSGAAGGTGSTIDQTLTLDGVNSGTAVYSITPTGNGCVGIPTLITITVNPFPNIGGLFIAVTPANCYDTAGSVLGLVMPPGQKPFTFVWENALGDTVGNGGLDLNNVIPGSYSLTVTDTVGCSLLMGPYAITSTSAVTAAFTADPTLGQTPLTVNLTNESVDATHYLWDFGGIDTSTQVDPTYIVVPTGQFQICLIAYNAFNCTDTACSMIDVDKTNVFIVPNVFTPNGDDVNDVFSIQGIGLASLDAQIFNRWGQKVFEWHTINGDWDGRTASGVPAPAGTYYYIIKAKGKDGKEYFEKGSFSLIRESK